MHVAVNISAVGIIYLYIHVGEGRIELIRPLPMAARDTSIMIFAQLSGNSTVAALLADYSSNITSLALIDYVIL